MPRRFQQYFKGIMTSVEPACEERAKVNKYQDMSMEFGRMSRDAFNAARHNELLIESSRSNQDKKSTKTTGNGVLCNMSWRIWKTKEKYKLLIAEKSGDVRFYGHCRMATKFHLKIAAIAVPE